MCVCMYVCMYVDGRQVFSGGRVRPSKGMGPLFRRHGHFSLSGTGLLLGRRRQRSGCMYVCMYVCIYVGMCMYVCTLGKYMCVSKFVCMYVRTMLRYTLTL